MTTIDSSPASAMGESAIGRLLAAKVDWATSADHKKIGRVFMGAGCITLLATLVVNILIGLERLDGGTFTLDSDSFLQLVSAQRVGLVFGAALPIAAGLCIAIAPLQLGARSIAFPRLAASGMYMWLGGMVLIAVSLAADGGFGGGDTNMVDLFLAAHGLMALGFTAVGVSLVTSVLTTRAPGMSMRRVPAFAWSAMVFGLGLVIVMPVLLGVMIYLFVDHRSGAREAFGGNAGIVTWAGWMFSSPTTFLMAIPAIGVFAELLPTTFSKRTPLRGAVFAGISLVGVSALAGATQQNGFDVPWRGSQLYIADGEDFANKLGDLVPWAIFHLLPLTGVGILILMMLFLAKPEKNEHGERIRPNIGAPFLFALFGFFMIVVGMKGSALEPIVDLALQGTVMAEASLVYISYGTVLALMGGVAHWAPKLWGTVIDLKKAAPLALLGVVGIVLASFPHYIAAFLDQPGGFVYDSDDSTLQALNAAVFAGHIIVALTILAFVGLLAASVFGGGGSAVDDPANGHTIEWATTSPAPANNFVDVPTITSAEPVLDMKTANTTGSAS